MTRRGGVVVLALALAARGAMAQAMRDFSTSRQLHGETRLDAHVEYGAGTLHIMPSASGNLYRMRVSYDAERFVPLSAFDAGTGSAHLGLQSTGTGFHIASRTGLDQTAFLTFSPDVALALDLTLGAVEGDIELGGLQLTNLRLSTGASRTVVRFSRPNRGRCERAELSAGAADVTLLALGNSRCQQVRFEGGVGKTVLDLTGAWPADAHLDIRMAVGALTLRLPRGTGIRLTMDRFLSSFPTRGWTRDGAGYVSSGYARATHRIDIALTSALGGVDVEWVN